MVCCGRVRLPIPSWASVTWPASRLICTPLTAFRGSAKYTLHLSLPPAIKRVRALHRKKGREEHGQYLVQGRKLVQEMFAEGIRPEALYATADAASLPGMADAVVMADHELARMGTLETGNEVVAVLRIPVHAPPSQINADALVLALDSVGDPGNMGTIIRLADWFGVQDLLLGAGCVDPFNPKCVQSAMGSLFRVRVHEVDLPERLKILTAASVHLHRAEMNGTPAFDAALQRPAILVLGSESHGISPEVSALPGNALSVPRIGGGESLNVAMAAAALCMEFARQADLPPARQRS